MYVYVTYLCLCIARCRNTTVSNEIRTLLQSQNETTFRDIANFLHSTPGNGSRHRPSSLSTLASAVPGGAGKSVGSDDRKSELRSTTANGSPKTDCPAPISSLASFPSRGTAMGHSNGNHAVADCSETSYVSGVALHGAIKTSLPMELPVAAICAGMNVPDHSLLFGQLTAYLMHNCASSSSSAGGTAPPSALQTAAIVLRSEDCRSTEGALKSLVTQFLALTPSGRAHCISFVVSCFLIVRPRAVFAQARGNCVARTA